MVGACGSKAGVCLVRHRYKSGDEADEAPFTVTVPRRPFQLRSVPTRPISSTRLPTMQSNLGNGVGAFGLLSTNSRINLSNGPHFSLTTLRSILRDALKRKMHALLSMSSVEQDKKLLNEHWEEIQRWCDVKGMECEHVSYRYAVWKGETGVLLLVKTDTTASAKGKVRVVLIDLSLVHLDKIKTNRARYILHQKIKV